MDSELHPARPAAVAGRMSIRYESVEVRTVENRAVCNDCNVEMEFGGVTLTTYPPLYPHRCPKCGTTQNLNNCYPCISYEPLGDKP